MARTTVTRPAGSRGLPRAGVKALADGLAGLLILPLLAGYRGSVLLAPGRTNGIFQGYSQLLSLFPGTTGNLLRRAFYRRTLSRCSGTCTISFGTILSTPGAEIGEHVYIGARCTIGLASLGDDVLIGSNVDILSGKHQHHFSRLDVPIRLQGGSFERTAIGRDAWIGNGACVGAEVGSQAVVAAGAVVVKPVGSRTIVGGNPARVLGQRAGTDGADAPARSAASC